MLNNISARITALLPVVAVLVALFPAHADAGIRTGKRHDPRMTDEYADAVVSAALTVDLLVEKINTSYMLGLRRCYNRGLATDPTLKGKITLAFTIGANGAVTGEASGIEAKVDACVASQLRFWKFSRPVDGRENTYRISLVLAR